MARATRPWPAPVRRWPQCLLRRVAIRNHRPGYMRVADDPQQALGPDRAVLGQARSPAQGLRGSPEAVPLAGLAAVGECHGLAGRAGRAEPEPYAVAPGELSWPGPPRGPEPLCLSRCPAGLMAAPRAAVLIWRAAECSRCHTFGLSSQRAWQAVGAPGTFGQPAGHQRHLSRKTPVCVRDVEKRCGLCGDGQVSWLRTVRAEVCPERKEDLM